MATVRLPEIFAGLRRCLNSLLDETGAPRGPTEEALLDRISHELEDIVAFAHAIQWRAAGARSGRFADRHPLPLAQTRQLADEAKARTDTPEHKAEMASWLAAYLEEKREEDSRLLDHLLPQVLERYPARVDASRYLTQLLAPPLPDDIPPEHRRILEELRADPRVRFTAALTPEALNTRLRRLEETTGYRPPPSPKARIRRGWKARQKKIL